MYGARAVWGGKQACRVRWASNGKSTGSVQVTATEPVQKFDTAPSLINTAMVDPTDGIDWSRSFHGLSKQAFSTEICDVLLAPLEPSDVEIKPDGILYLPEIKYRRILNRAFGPGGWGLAPRSETFVSAGNVSREYALVVHGRLVSIARGEQEYFPAKDPDAGANKSQDGIPTATEGAKSNALMRCCKDLGIASELWDPSFIRKWKKENAREDFVEHQVTKRKRKLWRRKDGQWDYPYKLV
ncbi:hypothetical protein PYCC9005_001038 [Savitreella phatthalungensis]